MILQSAPTFFGLTMDGSLELAQMAIARLYDKTSSAVTIRGMLAHAAMEVNSFSRGTREQVSEAIADSKKKVATLEPKRIDSEGLNQMLTTLTKLPVTPTNLVCPFCRAGAGKPCITSGGKGFRTDSLGAVLVHVARIKRAAQANAKRVRQTQG